jgi:hydrogenase maturation protease
VTAPADVDGRNGVALAPLVVGLGSSERGDDAVGPRVASAIASLHLPGVRVVEHEDPTGLLDLWAGHEPVVVVDAVRSGQPPGTLHHLETGDGSAPLPRAAWSGTGQGGTHAFGVAAAVELARALHQLPDRLVIIGVEAAGFDYQAPLSAPVAKTLETAIARVLAVLAGVPVPDPVHGDEGVADPCA